MTEDTWVCDGCLRTVTRPQIRHMVDWEHVLCRRCSDETENDPRGSA